MGLSQADLDQLLENQRRARLGLPPGPLVAAAKPKQPATQFPPRIEAPLGVVPVPAAKARGTPREPAMNGTEKRYHQHLAMQYAVRQVLWYRWAPFNVRLADNTHYRIDFAVMLIDFTFEVHELKGRKVTKNEDGSRDQGYYTREMGNVKVKLSAEVLPFVHRIVWPVAGGGWASRVI